MFLRLEFSHVLFKGEVLGALCARKGPVIFVECQEEILKNVRDNLHRRLPEPEDVTEGLVHKLTSGENGAGVGKVCVSFFLPSYSLQSSLFKSVLFPSIMFKF